MVRKIKSLMKKNNIDVEKLIEENLHFRKEIEKLLDHLEDAEGEKAYWKCMAMDLKEEIKNLRFEVQLKTRKTKISNEISPMKSRKKLANQEKIKKVLKDSPGISITELSKKVEISRNSLYRYYRDIISAK